jgi:hypothetical protein
VQQTVARVSGQVRALALEPVDRWQEAAIRTSQFVFPLTDALEAQRPRLASQLTEESPSALVIAVSRGAMAGIVTAVAHSGYTVHIYGMREPIRLYEFRYRCPLRKRWVKARYRATLEEIGHRYAEWETIGEPEVREVDPNNGYFNPYRGCGDR